MKIKGKTKEKLAVYASRISEREGANHPKVGHILGRIKTIIKKETKS